MKFYLFICILGSVIHSSRQETEYNSDSNEVQSLIGLGREKYREIAEKVSLPVYGLCWKNAVKNLHKGCKHLSEHVQRNLALRFMDCFLVMSGHKPYSCEAEDGNECITSMSDRAFNVYTEFYTHTQNICFYLQSQVWREETENSINRLSRTSAHVTEQLEHAEAMQTTLLTQQKESMTVQQELLDNGLSLNELLQASQNSLNKIMTEFRLATVEQRKMLFDVFERLSSLQAWAVGEISWLDSVVFYLTSSIIAYIITATPRTQGARIWIFLTISANILIERSICTYVLQDTVSELTFLNQNLSWWVWLCRKSLIGVCCIILTICIYTYRDYNLVNHKLLMKIQEQNSQLIEHIKMLDSSFTSSPGQSRALINYTRNCNNNILTSTMIDETMSETPDVFKNKIHENSHSRNPSELRESPIRDYSPSPVKKSISPAPSTSSSASTLTKASRKVARPAVMEIISPFPRYSLRSSSRSKDNYTALSNRSLV